MNAFVQLLQTELKFQWRHGFILAAIVVTLVWAALLSVMPAEHRPFWFGIVSALDVSSIGLLFGFGLGVLDKNQAAIFAIRLTPAPSWFSAFARMCSLTLLITATLGSLAFMVLEASTAIKMLPGIILCGSFFSTLGITAARRFATMNSFIVFFATSSIIWAMPAIYYAELVSSPIWLALPSAGAMVFFRGAFDSVPAGLLLFGFALQAFWTVLTFYLGERWASISFAYRFGGH